MNCATAGHVAELRVIASDPVDDEPTRVQCPRCGRTWHLHVGIGGETAPNLTEGS